MLLSISYIISSPFQPNQWTQAGERPIQCDHVLSCTCLRKAYLERSSGPPFRGWGSPDRGLERWVPFWIMACCWSQWGRQSAQLVCLMLAHPSIPHHISIPKQVDIKTADLLIVAKPTKVAPNSTTKPPSLSSRKRPVSTYSAMNRSMCFTNALLACRHGIVSIGLFPKMSKAWCYPG